MTSDAVTQTEVEEEVKVQVPEEVKVQAQEEENLLIEVLEEEKVNNQPSRYASSSAPKFGGRKRKSEDSQDKCHKCRSKIQVKRARLSIVEVQMLKDFFSCGYLGEIEMLLENCMFSAKQVTTLINDLLDLAKLEKGQFTFNNEYFNLKETIFQGI